MLRALRSLNRLLKELEALGVLIAIVALGLGVYELRQNTEARIQEADARRSEAESRRRERINSAWSRVAAYRPLEGQLNLGLHDALRTLYVEGADVSRVDLRGAYLPLLNLPPAARVQALSLEGANFSGTELRNAIAPCSNLRDFKLNEAALTWADLRRANLVSSEFKGALIRFADFSGSVLNYTTFDKAQIYHSRFNYATLCCRDISDAVFHDSDFKNAYLYEMKLNADFARSNFAHATFKDVDMREVNLYLVNLGDADLSAARGLSPAQLSRACVHDGNLQPKLPADFAPVTLPVCHSEAGPDSWGQKESKLLRDYDCIGQASFKIPGFFPN